MRFSRRKHLWCLVAAVGLLLLGAVGLSSSASARRASATHAHAAQVTDNVAGALTRGLPRVTQLRDVLGQAFLEHPLSGASVSLYALNGRLLPAAGRYDVRTSPDGFFTVHPRRLPRNFRVAVSGGRDGRALSKAHLQALVVNYNGAIDIGVDAATTLQSVYHNQHPRVPLRLVSQRVLAFLGLPAGYDIGVQLVTVSNAFDQAEFMGRARKAGGFDVYVAKLAERIAHAGSHQSFVHAPRRAGRLTAHVSAVPLSSISAGLTLAFKAWKTIACLAKKFEFGCVVNAFAGGGGGNEEQLAELRAIHEQLTQVANQISQLQVLLTTAINNLHNTLLQTQWNNVQMSFQTSLYGEISSAYDNLMASTNPSYTPQDRTLAAQRAREAMNSLANKGADGTMANNLIGQGGATGALAQWSDLVRQQADGSSSGFFAFSDRRYTPQRGGYVYHGLADLIPEEWAFFDTWQGKLEYVLIEGDNALGHSKTFVDEQVIAPYLGVPISDAQKPLSQKPRNACGSRPVTSTCRGWRDQELARVGSPLPDEAVIDVRTGLMWSTRVWNQSYPPPPNVTPKGGKAWADAVVSDFYNNPAYFLTWGGFSNWRLPTEAELKALFKDRTQVPGLRSHLSDQGGFFTDPPSQSSHQPLDRLGNDGLAWTSTRAGNQYVLGSLVTGAFSNGNGPANVIVVRDVGPCELYYDDLSRPVPPPC
jgi:hypothetical protein